MKKITPINYIELPIKDMDVSKAFYSAVFGWEYTDYGPSYAAIDNAGIDGGLDAQSDRQPSATGSLVVMLTDDLYAAQTRIEAAGGVITVPIFEFPGGQRFHFSDPSGNELAVWTVAEPE